MRYVVYAARDSEINDGWVWMKSPPEGLRPVVKISRPETGHTVYCEARRIDRNFLALYRASKYRRKITDPRNALIASDWYRKKLGNLETGHDYELDIRPANSWHERLRACNDHPQNVVRISMGLGKLSLFLSVVSLAISLITTLGPHQTGDSRQSLRASATLSGKGMELYSWKPAGKDWHFSLLLGTNRNKTMAEVTDPSSTAVGTKAIEDKLSVLPVGECVNWCNLAKEPVPQSTADEMRKLCKSLDIRLDGPLPPGPNLVH